MIKHTHKFSIADKDAVQTLIGKLADDPQRNAHADGLMKALDDAARHYSDSSQKVRQAFFHGLLTGYAVGLKLAQEGRLTQPRNGKGGA